MGPARTEVDVAQVHSERERLILREVVEAYIASGEAVGSKAVAERLRHALSSASIRSTMHALGDLGLLVKPHSSAGRVPTDRGYRAYLDDLVVLSRRGLPSAEPLRALTWDEGYSALDVLRGAARTLSEDLGAVSLVFAPRLETAVLERIELVWIGPGRVLAVAVTRGGLVHERLLQVGPELFRDHLEGLSNYLNALLPGRSLGEIRAVIEAEQARDQAAHSALEQQALELGRRALGQVESSPLVVDGAARILEAREFAEAPAKALDLLRALDQRAAWLDLLDRVATADDIEVYVGTETGRVALEPCALVAGRYDTGGGVGLVAVLGPKRLDYRRAIPVVRSVAQRLSTVLRGRGHELPAAV